MTKNPYKNALAAVAYIAVVAVIMFYGPKYAQLENKPDTLLVPISVISLFSFSAAMMGYIFLFNPVQLYLDGKKKQAVDLFTKTLLAFGAVTFVLLLLVFSGIIK